MEDHFSSTRFLLISALIVMVGVIIASMVGMSIQEESKGMAKPTLIFLLLFTSTGKLFSFVQFIGFFGPLIGIILGFDSINRERVSRTLSKLVSQPIYRDSIINAKFLAGVTTIAIVLVAIILIISGLGIRLIGVVPGAEEIWRLVIYPDRQPPLHLLLVGDIHSIFRGLSEHGHFCPGLPGGVDIFLLFCQPGGRCSGGCRCSDQSEQQRSRSQCAHQA